MMICSLNYRLLSKGVELRNLCCFDLPHLRAELCKAVKRVRQKPHIVVRCFHDLNL